MKSFKLFALLMALCLALSALPALAEDAELPVSEDVEAAPAELEGELLTDDMQAAPQPESAVMAAEDGAQAVDAVTGLSITEATFPDEALRKYILQAFDTDGNGALSDEEINAVTLLEIDGNVEDVTGIERFTKAASLVCSSDALTELDISGLTGLESVYIETDCKLKKLVLGKQPKLKEIMIQGTLLETVDFTGCPNLEGMYLGENRLTKLNISKNRKLKYLYVYDNRLTKLDVSKNTKLEILDAGYNNLSAINVKKNTALQVLVVSNNPRISALNISKNKKLNVVMCGFTKVKSLNISNNKYLIAMKKKLFPPYTYKCDGYSGSAIAWGAYGKDSQECIELPVTAKLYNGKTLLYKSGTPTKVALNNVVRADNGKALKIKNSKLTLKLAGETIGYYLTLKLTPANVACNVTLTSSNPDILSVNPDGYFETEGRGTAKLYAYIGKKKVCTLTVTVK